MRYDTWTGKDAGVLGIYPGTTMVTMQDVQVHAVRDGHPMQSAAIAVKVYGRNYACTVEIAISPDETEQLNNDNRQLGKEAALEWIR